MYQEEAVREIFEDIYHEVARQETLWGVQAHPDGTGKLHFKAAASKYRKTCDAKAETGEITYADIALEEFFEAMAENPRSEQLIHELTQTAAVLVSWLRKLKDRNLA